jgi:hypothetical protein
MGAEGGLVMANPIYREVLPRVLTVVPMAAMPQIAPSFFEFFATAWRAIVKLPPIWY